MKNTAWAELSHLWTETSKNGSFFMGRFKEPIPYLSKRLFLQMGGFYSGSGFIEFSSCGSINGRALIRSTAIHEELPEALPETYVLLKFSGPQQERF